MSGLEGSRITVNAGGALLIDGVSVEVGLPWPRMDHRRWSPHPLCTAHPGATNAPTHRSA